MRTIERRQRVGRKPVEGIAPFVLAAIGGVAAMVLWLKVGALVGLREFSSSNYRWSYLVTAAVAGACLGLAGQAAWGLAGRALARMLSVRASAPELRLIWGAAAFPQVASVFVLLPLDLLVVGAEAFTTDQMNDPVATAWTAISVALTVSLGAWSAFLFARGMQVTSELDTAGSVLAFLAAVVLTAVLVAAVGALALLVAGSR